MNMYQLIKQAYAYGASAALVDAGYGEYNATVEGEKLASFEMEKVAANDEDMSPALMALLGAGAGTALGAGGGALAGRLGNVNLMNRLMRAAGGVGKAPKAPSFLEAPARSGAVFMPEAGEMAAMEAAAAGGGKGRAALEKLLGAIKDLPQDVQMAARRQIMPGGLGYAPRTMAGSAALGGAAGAGLGALGGGLYGGLSD